MKRELADHGPDRNSAQQGTVDGLQDTNRFGPAKLACIQCGGPERLLTEVQGTRPQALLKNVLGVRRRELGRTVGDSPCTSPRAGEAPHG